MLKCSKKKRTAGFWQGRSISLPKKQSAMNRIPLDEMYLLYSLYGFRELTKEEQSRFSITKFEYEPYPELFKTRKASRRNFHMHWPGNAQKIISMSMYCMRNTTKRLSSLTSEKQLTTVSS